MEGFGQPWFAAKRYGYGAGRPIAWQGWALLVGQLLLIALGSALLRGMAQIAWLVTIVIVSLPVIAAKTKGGWRWRWGGED